ncbi:DUF2589 domain-containing protein [Roseivirga sp. E12]|uniref:DUF2589 domain-containing protein n=1 Tax=Roseivirga sp. E12 TaxID=2819237 RepID=UPI001ABC28CB|nr:DUF2589 domain-containing protein [Roseivirga sp. E12]MBO3696818.1 DUF2589 domain-containing protein [Roseivirga sp. E12]
MPESQNQSFKPSFGKELNIESIISAPLVAASKANVMMVTGQTRFLLEYCFTKEDGKTYEPVMIEMSMVRGVIDDSKKPTDPGYIQKAQLTFNIPLLCLVPLNSLAIDKVTVDFDMEITSVTSKESTKKVGENNIMDKKAQLNGKISGGPSGDKNNTQSTSKLKVGINAGPLPLPVGVLAILDLYTKNIQPLPEEKKPESIEE